MNTLALPPIPKKINVRITENDRLKADHYTEPCFCLLATTLRRLGYQIIGVTPNRVHLKGRVAYEINRQDADELHWVYNDTMPHAPFYRREIVGKIIHLQRCNTVLD